jgi:hypothetical protein
MSNEYELTTINFDEPQIEASLVRAYARVLSWPTNIIEELLYLSGLKYDDVCEMFPLTNDSIDAVNETG